MKLFEVLRFFKVVSEASTTAAVHEPNRIVETQHQANIVFREPPLNTSNNCLVKIDVADSNNSVLQVGSHPLKKKILRHLGRLDDQDSAASIGT